METEIIKEGTNGFQRFEKMHTIVHKGDYIHLLFMENGYSVERQFHVKEVHHRIERNRLVIYVK